MKSDTLIVAAAVLVTACDSALVTIHGVHRLRSGTRTRREASSSRLNGRRSIAAIREPGDRGVSPTCMRDNLDFTGTYQTDQEFSLRNIQSTNGAISPSGPTRTTASNRANGVLAANSRRAGPQQQPRRTCSRAQRCSSGRGTTSPGPWFGEAYPWCSIPSSGVGEESLGEHGAHRKRSTLQSSRPGGGRAASFPRDGGGKATRERPTPSWPRPTSRWATSGQARDKAAALPQRSHLQPGGAIPRPLFTTKHTAESIYEVALHREQQQLPGLLGSSPQEELGGRWASLPPRTLRLYEASTSRAMRPSTSDPPTSRYIYKYAADFARRTTTSPGAARGDVSHCGRSERQLGAADATVLADINVVRARPGPPP